MRASERVTMGQQSARSRLSFLMALDDATRPVTDPAEITRIAATHLGVHLQVNRCAYAEVESDENTFTLLGNYHQGVDSIVGRYRFADFGEACLRSMRAESLRELGFTVLQASNADSALQVLAAHGEIDLLFTDVGLPGLNGRELVERARDLRPQLRVLFTTGYARDAIVHHGRLDAGVDLLAKPFTRDQLAAKIRQSLDAPASVIN